MQAHRGLGVTVRSRGGWPPRLRRRLLQLNVAFSFVRHVLGPLVDYVVADLAQSLRDADSPRYERACQASAMVTSSDEGDSSYFCAQVPPGNRRPQGRRGHWRRGVPHGGGAFGGIECGAGPAVRSAGGRFFVDDATVQRALVVKEPFVEGELHSAPQAFVAGEQKRDIISDGLEAVLASNVCAAHRRLLQRFAVVVACTVGSGTREALAVTGWKGADLQSLVSSAFVRSACCSACACGLARRQRIGQTRCGVKLASSGISTQRCASGTTSFIRPATSSLACVILGDLMPAVERRAPLPADRPHGSLKRRRLGLLDLTRCGVCVCAFLGVFIVVLLLHLVLSARFCVSFRFLSFG